MQSPSIHVDDVYREAHRFLTDHPSTSLRDVCKRYGLHRATLNRVWARLGLQIPTKPQSLDPIDPKFKVYVRADQLNRINVHCRPDESVHAAARRILNSALDLLDQAAIK